MSLKDSQGPRGGQQRAAVTEVKCSDDLHATLTELLARQSKDSIYQLEGILGSIKREFDPATVTMTATNIPDAVTKLSCVLAQTSQAATRVFELVERQKSLIEENESCLSDLEGLLGKVCVDTAAVQQIVEKGKVTQLALREVSHEMVMAQEYQDLCAQNVEKVMRLLDKLDGDLRALLIYFNVAPSGPESPESALDNPDIGQGDADEILKRFGIS
jgi:chemotaxis regulatin CheY-phosphate phosphatase CheZ